MTKCVWLPDSGGWMMGWASLGKTAVTTFEVSSRVVGGLSPASSDVAITGVCLRCRSSQLLKHCWVVHTWTVSVTLLQCWPSFTVLHLAVATPVAVSVYFSDTGWSEHSCLAGDHWLSHTRRPSELPVCRISSQRSSSPIGSHEICNPVHCRSRPLLRGLVSTQQTDVTVGDAPSHIWKLFVRTEL